MIDHGQNNGSLWLSVRAAAARMGMADVNAARNAFRELEEMGFIEMTKEAHFSVKAADTSRARCWRLTFLFDYANRKSATNDWKERRPKAKSPANRRMLDGCKALKRFQRAIAQDKIPVLDFNTTDTE